MARNRVESAERAVRFDQGRHPRAKIGYVLLATEQTIEEDVMRLTPPGVGVHFTRVAIPDSITAETLAEQAPSLGEAAALILPDGSLDVICYACTSGSLVIGEERVFAELARGAPGAKATSLITGVIRALRTLEAHKLVVATPTSTRSTPWRRTIWRPPVSNCWISRVSTSSATATWCA